MPGVRIGPPQALSAPFTLVQGTHQMLLFRAEEPHMHVRREWGTHEGVPSPLRASVSPSET